MRRYTCLHIISLLITVMPGYLKCAAQEYIFNHLSTRDGLASNNILALHQDKKGFLWIGTENGLQRYDGYRFTAAALQKGVNQILEDAAGTLWLRMGRVTGIFNPSWFAFTEVPLLENIGTSDPGLFQLGRDADKNIFLLVKGHGCFYLNKNKTGFTAKNTPFELPEGYRVLSVTDDPKEHRYWLNTSGGLGYYDKRDKQFYSFQNNLLHHPLLADRRFSSGILQFYIDSRRRYWIEQWNDKRKRKEYYCFDERTGNFTKDTLGLGEAGYNGYYDIYRFTEFNDTTVLFYGYNCMSMREDGRFTKFLYADNDPYGIQFDVVNDVLEDREHILWVATDDGLYTTMANINNNRHLMIGQGKGKAAVNCLMEDADKNIWIGTWGIGMMVVDSNLAMQPQITKAVRPAGDVDVKLTWCVQQEAATKKVWIGCQSGKLVIFDPKDKKTTILQPPPFEHRTVRQMVRDKRGRLWFGLQSGKLFTCHPDSGKGNNFSFREVHRFSSFISKLNLDRDGHLWIAVAGAGIYVMDIVTGAVLKTYLFNSSTGALSGGDIKDVLPLNDSTFMIAAENLDQLNIRTGAVKTVSLYDNTPLGKVYSIQPGVKDDCWISTANGIYRYNIPTGVLTRYTQWDGLITVFNNSFLPEFSLRLHNNKLVFAGNRHFVLFDPERYKKTTVPPDVQLTGFRLFDAGLPVDSITSLPALRLPHQQNSFTLDFASLSFTQLEKLTYEYKLEGADKDWIKVARPQPVRYSLLPPGTYRFLVRSKNSEGMYSGKVTSLTIIIIPPFWKTWPFFALLLLAAGSFLYYLHRLRLQRLLQVEKVRAGLARDLHDDMGSTLSTINIISNMALQQQNLDEATHKNFMTKISESTSQMMESMDDIIWSINPLNDCMGKVLARMKQVAGSVLEPKGIEYCFKAEEAVKDLSFTMEWRREIFLIYKEAINNIVKYADCSAVEVVLQKSGRSFFLQIRDDGVGFDAGEKKEAAPTRGNGFVNMHKRARAMRGTLQISSAKHAGTQVALTIPLA